MTKHMLPDHSAQKALSLTAVEMPSRNLAPNCFPRTESGLNLP